MSTEADRGTPEAALPARLEKEWIECVRHSDAFALHLLEGHRLGAALLEAFYVWRCVATEREQSWPALLAADNAYRAWRNAEGGNS